MAELTDPSFRPAVSVIVPVRNDARGVAELLACLAEQTASSSSFEVLVVDDESTDDTPRIVRESRVARLVRCPTRWGSYRARNVGIEAAQAEVLAFTDGDCAPAPDWIERGLSGIAEGAERIAGHIEVPLGDDPSTAAMLDAALHLDQRRYVGEGFGATANLWVRRSVFDRVGPFNAQLQSGGDKEFGLRATRAGVGLAYDEKLIVRHPPRSLLRELARKSYRLGSGAANHNYRGHGPVADRDANWSHLRSYLPPGRRLPIEDRLRSRGIAPTDAVLRRISLAHYFSMQLPHVLGGLAVALREERLNAVRRLFLDRAAP
jgi:glycosyltransferase involved in cell wall biosynthesis